MGVQGLWKLLEPVGKPVTLESLQGKILAVDLSLWIHQAIRGCAGRANEKNAHLIVLFRRILKLLFYGVRPVFVFDGPNVPYFKKFTLSRRRMKQDEAAEKVTKIQKKILKHLAAELISDKKNVKAKKEQRKDVSLDVYTPSVSSETVQNFDEVSCSSDDEEFVPDVPVNLDLDSDQFSALPANLQHDILLNLRENARFIRRRVELPKDSDDFSKYQLNNLLKKGRINQKLDQVQKNLAACDPTLSLLNDRGEFKVKAVYHNDQRRHILLETVPASLALPADQIPAESSEIAEENTLNSTRTSSSIIIKQKGMQTIPAENQSIPTENRSISMIPVPHKNSCENFDVEQIVEIDRNSKNDEEFRSNSFEKIDNKSIEIEINLKNDLFEDNFDTFLASSSNSTVKFDGKFLNLVQDDFARSDDDESFVEVEEIPVIPIDFDDDRFAADEFESKNESVDDSNSKNAEKIDETIENAEKIDETIENAEKIDETIENAEKIDDTIENAEKIDETIENAEKTDKTFKIDENFGEETLEELLNQRRKAESNEKTINSQILEECEGLLKLFGVPIVRAPGEAEAQCAYIEGQGMTMGTITDDSDVWLFGGKSVFRHVFDKKQFVKKFESIAIERFLGLTRQKLIQLALLVGCDYTLGVTNIGVVSAMEILSEFSAHDDTEVNLLKQFKSWWDDCQKVKKPPGNQVLSRLSNLDCHFPSSFPDSQVFKAFIEPNVDRNESKLTAFEWTTPDVEGLRRFAGVEFGWSKEKIDDMLLPAVRRFVESLSSKQTSIRNFVFTLTSEDDKGKISQTNRVREAIRKLKRTENDEIPKKISKKKVSDDSKTVKSDTKKVSDEVKTVKKFSDEAKGVKNGTKVKVRKLPQQRRQTRMSKRLVSKKISSDIVSALSDSD